MNDTELRASLRSLPRATASPRFNSEVRRRIAAPAARAPLFSMLRVATAFALVLCVFAAINASMIMRAHQREKLDRLRAEHQRIEADLAAVKKLASDVEPVVVLENDDTRVVVDLPAESSQAQLVSNRIID